jgi:mannose-6-phosphate isomerase
VWKSEAEAFQPKQGDVDTLYPLTFHPRFKERVWGGRRLEELYGKALPPAVTIGESWELSDRPGDVSVVANGQLASKDLHFLVHEFRERLLGYPPPDNRSRFPLLVKILDSRDRLSLQVHPPAAKAVALGGEPKTEFWYIADAAPGAQLYVGLKRGCTRNEFIQRMEQGTVEECFHRVPVQTGDAMFLPSGRVHALGAGMVIFEIQQNSDTTYRVFDWNRLGLDGKPRDLHIRESLDSIDFDDFEPELIRQQRSPGVRELQSLVNHPLFSVDLGVLTSGEKLSLDQAGMQIICAVAGNVEISAARTTISLSSGNCCLLPACLENPVVRASKSARLLRVVAGQGA